MKKETSKKKKIFLLILRYTILIVLLAGLVIFIKISLGNRKVKTYSRPIPSVELITATQGPISRKVSFPSYVEAKDMVPIVPFVKGEVVKYNIKVGDILKKDDVIAVIDDEIFAQQLKQAEAADKAYSETLKRVKKLAKKNAASKQQLDEIQAKADAGKAQLELAKIQMSYATIKSPINGTVLLAPTSVGSPAAAPNPVAVIADLNKLVINIKISEEYYNKIKDNYNELEVFISQPGNEKLNKDRTKVISLSPFLEATTKMFTLRCEIESDVNHYKPGMYVIADIVYDQSKDSYYLPQSVKKTDGNLYYYSEKDGKVYFLSSDKFKHLIQNSQYFEIPESYKNYKFVCDGQNNVIDGQKVVVVEGKK